MINHYVLLPINARTVAPGFPQAIGRVHVVGIDVVGEERVEAVESVGPVQLPPAAGWMWLIVVLLAPWMVLHPCGGVAAGLLHAATVLLNSVKRPSEAVLVHLPLTVVQKLLGLVRRAQTVDLKRGAVGRGAVGLRVQRGGGRWQGALPPDASPLSAAAVCPRQFTKHSPGCRHYMPAALDVRAQVCI